MIIESKVKCPQCNHISTLKMPEDMWLMWYKCEECNKIIWGKDNPHGWNCVFCSYSDTSWQKIQELEKIKQNIWMISFNK